VHHSKFAGTMSLMGHSRRFTTARSRSALPPIADIRADIADGSFVPILLQKSVEGGLGE